MQQYVVDFVAFKTLKERTNNVDALTLIILLKLLLKQWLCLLRNYCLELSMYFSQSDPAMKPVEKDSEKSSLS